MDLGLINENTIIIGHSIAPVFISKFLTENKLKVKKLIFVCGFNNYLGINEEYDAVNKTMYFDDLEDVKQYANEIICFYLDNDPYVKYEVEKDFANKIATEDGNEDFLSFRGLEIMLELLKEYDVLYWKEKLGIIYYLGEMTM